MRHPNDNHFLVAANPLYINEIMKIGCVIRHNRF